MLGTRTARGRLGGRPASQTGVPRSSAPPVLPVPVPAADRARSIARAWPGGLPLSAVALLHVLASLTVWLPHEAATRSPDRLSQHARPRFWPCLSSSPLPTLTGGLGWGHQEACTRRAAVPAPTTHRGRSMTKSGREWPRPEIGGRTNIRGHLMDATLASPVWVGEGGRLCPVLARTVP